MLYDIKIYMFSPPLSVSLAHEWDTELGMLTTISWQQTSSIAGKKIL